MSKGVDYSKWDHFGESSEDDEPLRREPVVTKFETPQSVVIGGANDEEIGSRQIDGKQGDGKNKSSVADPSIVEANTLCRNGGMTKEYLWAQSRHGVVAHIFLPPDTKGKDISLTIQKGKKKFGESRGDDGFEGGRELIIKINQSIFIDKLFPFPVKTEDEMITWEVKSMKLANIESAISTSDEGDSTEETRRVLIISLTKHVVVADSVVWWTRLFDGDASIDIATISDEDRFGRGVNAAKLKKESASFSQIWKEANQKFVEKQQKIKKSGDDTRLVID